MTNNFASIASASAVAFSLGIAALPGAAHAGFLEQLFGIAPQPAPQAAAPVPHYDAPQYYQDAPVHHRAKRKVVVDDKPKLQKPTDLMHDATLQTGDAIMMKGGIHIYTGDDRVIKHTKADFEPMDAVDGLPKQERKALIALNVTHNDHLRSVQDSDPIVSGRSASVASPVAKGQAIVDARGVSVRYVGP